MDTNKSVLTTTLLGALALGSGTVQAAQVVYGTFIGAGAVSNFTILSPQGTGCTANCEGTNEVLGGPGYAWGHTNDVTFTWDGTVFTSSADYAGPSGTSNATISSPAHILGLSWTTHDVQLFGTGTYSFDTSLGGGTLESGIMTMTVGAGQLGVHMLMDWNASNDIDIVNVWNLNSTFSNCGVSVSDPAASNCLFTGGTNTAGNNANTIFTFASTDNDNDGTLGIPMDSGSPFAGHNFNLNLQGTLTTVPIPAAAWLFTSGLIGLFGFARTRNRPK